MSETPGIVIDQLYKRYEKSADYTLENISLTVNRGDVFGLLGPNGAGKTTLISILCGIIPQTSGTVTYYGKSGEISAAERRSVIGFVPQEYAFYQELTPRQNLDYFGALYNLSKAEVLKRREHLLNILGLSKFADNKVGTFSGGMKRRVNLAIGMIHEPEILFLDEPTVGVDVQSKNAIIRYLQDVNATGTTIVYTSHHMSEAEEFCNRICMVDHGKVIAQGELTGLMTAHGSENLQSLFIKLTGEAYRD